MQKIKIVTDSNAGFKKEEAEALNVKIVPMPFFIDGEEFFEGETLTQDKFYELLKNDTNISTSQPSAYMLEELFKEILKDCDEIIYIPMSSGLSMSCESAKNVASKFGGRVKVVDNKRISVMQKTSVIEAVKMVNIGKTSDEIVEYLLSTKSNQIAYIMVDTLKYLKKGGRVSPAVAMVGGLLKIKPVLYSSGENFERFTMAMNVTQAKKKMIEQIKKHIETDFSDLYNKGLLTLAVAYTKNRDAGEKFKEELVAEFPLVKFSYVDALSLSVSCHIGPGALACALIIDSFQ